MNDNRTVQENKHKTRKFYQCGINTLEKNLGHFFAFFLCFLSIMNMNTEHGFSTTQPLSEHMKISNYNHNNACLIVNL